MNMISTGAFLNEMDASNKQPTVAEKFAAVWEKKNAKAARAGGVSLMALSLAACGSSSTTTTTSTTTDTTTTTPAVDAAEAIALTIGADTGSAYTGGSGNDTFDGSRIDGIVTLNASDVLDGGAGTDTLTARTVNGLSTSSISNIENITFTETGSGGDSIVFSTASATYISGVTNISNVGSTNNLTFSRVTEISELTVNNVATTTTLQFSDTVLSGSADTVTINLNGVTEAVTVGTVSDADGDYETLVVNASGAASDLNAGNGLGADATTVDVNATAALDLGSTASLAKVTTFDASDSTAGVTAVFADRASTGSPAITLTGGSGNDSFDIGALTDADVGVLTANMGAGDDTLDIGANGATDFVMSGGDGEDSFAVDRDNMSTNFSAAMSDFEVLKVNTKAVNADTIDVTNFDGLNSVNLAAGYDNDVEITSLVSGATITLGVADNANTSTDKLTLTLETATGSADEVSVTMKTDGTNDFDYGSLVIDNIETLNVAFTMTGSTTDNDITLGIDNDTDLNNLVLSKSETGDGSLNKVTVDTALTTVESVDATALGETDLEIDFTGNTGGVVYLGSAGVDTVTLDDAATATGGDSNDVFTILKVASVDAYATITDLTAGDTVNFLDNDTNDDNDAVFNSVELSLGSTASFDDYANLAFSQASDDNDAELSWFQYDGDTYLAFDFNGGGATFTASEDQIVKISGLVDLSDSTIAANTNVLTIA